MATDLVIYLDDRPGQLAAVGSTLGAADINIDGGFALVVGGQGIMHVLVEDGDQALRALSDAGFEVREQHEVLILDADDRPGALGEIAQRVADAGVNLSVFYMATATRVVVGAEDLQGVREALES